MQVVDYLDIIHNQLKSCLYIVVLRELWLLKQSVQIIYRAMSVIGCYNLQGNSNVDSSFDSCWQERHSIGKQFQYFNSISFPWSIFMRIDRRYYP